jgi:hypothetical protein
MLEVVLGESLTEEERRLVQELAGQGQLIAQGKGSTTFFVQPHSGVLCFCLLFVLEFLVGCPISQFRLLWFDYTCFASFSGHSPPGFMLIMVIAQGKHIGSVGTQAKAGQFAMDGEGREGEADQR